VRSLKQQSSFLTYNSTLREDSANAYLQERPRTSLLLPLSAPANFVTADPARAQESRQGWHPRACQGQRAARKGPKADIDCKYPHLLLSFHRDFIPGYHSGKQRREAYGRAGLIATAPIVPELPTRNRQHEQGPARGPCVQARCETVAQRKVLAQRLPSVKETRARRRQAGRGKWHTHAEGLL
jgi:hypothetical protein